MNKNLVRTRRHIRGLNIVRPHRAVLFLVVLVIAASIQLASPWAAFAVPVQTLGNDLRVQETPSYNASLPVTATSAQAGTMQNSLRNWGFGMLNVSPTPVTNVTGSFESGYDPSLFPGVVAFPVTRTISSIAPGQVWGPSPLLSNIPVNFTLGYDSTRTVSPLTIPVGGTQQTVTITITARDSRYIDAPDAEGAFIITIDSNLPGISIVSTSNPNNLDQGETLVSPYGHAQWRLGSPQLNKQYTFTAVLNVPNPFGVPFEYRPSVNILGVRNILLCNDCPGSTVTIKDPTLDGNVPGSGAVTISIAETNHTWTLLSGFVYSVLYNGTQVTPVTIVIKPGDGQPAPVNPKSTGTIPVAILSTSSFDATTVDPTTVKFGATGTEASSTQTSLEDVNGDGRLDMVLHFNTQQTGIVCGTTTVTLTGKTTSGQLISGTALITTVSCG
jgi:hypothetical protein